MYDIKDTLVFAHVVKATIFSDAAKRLAAWKSLVSKSVSRLEAKLACVCCNGAPAG